MVALPAESCLSVMVALSTQTCPSAIVAISTRPVFLRWSPYTQVLSFYDGRLIHKDLPFCDDRYDGRRIHKGLSFYDGRLIHRGLSFYDGCLIHKVLCFRLFPAGRRKLISSTLPETMKSGWGANSQD